MAEAMTIQLVYATATAQYLRELNLPVGSRVQDAIMQSGVLAAFPEIDLQKNRVGVFGKLKSLDAVLRDHDRVEIYRPLIADPKESRRRRMAQHAETVE